MSREIKIGDRVKATDQDITGTVIEYDSGSKVVILDDDNDWCDVNEEARLVFNISDLERK